MSILRGHQRELPNPILLHRYFEKALEQETDSNEFGRPSVIFQEKRTSYKHVNEMSNKVARKLIELTHGSDSLMTHGSDPPMSHGSDPLMTHGSDPLMTHGSDPPMTHGSDPLMMHGSDPLMTHGSDPPMTHGSDPPMTHGTDPPMTHGSDPLMTHGSDPPRTHGPDPLMTHGPDPLMTHGSDPLMTHGSDPLMTHGSHPLMTHGSDPLMTHGSDPLMTHGSHPLMTHGSHPLMTHGSDPLIAVDLQPSDSLIIVLMAIIKAGGAYVAVDSQSAVNRVRYILNEVKPLYVITQKESGIMKGASTTWSRFHILDYEELFTDNSLNVENLADRETIARHSVVGDRLACVTYTSGSTGTPKGVRLSHANIMNRLSWQWHYIPFCDDGDEVGCFKTSLLFVDSIVEIFSCLLKQVDLAICPTQVKINTERFVAFLEENNVTRLVMVPSLIRNVLAYTSLSGGACRLPRMRTWVSSGEALTPTLLETFFSTYSDGKVTYNLYGSSETTGDVTYEKFSDMMDVQSKTFANHLSIGRPMDNCVVYIVDSNNHVLRQNSIGEICISGLNVAHGYMERDKYCYFGDNTLEEHPLYDNLYHTGDYGLIKDDMLIYQGRRDSQLKIRGHRVDISEIERAVMGSSDAVDKVVVICHEYRESVNRVVAFFTTTVGSPLDIESVRASCKTSLSAYMIPKLMHVQYIPLQPHTGKVDREALTEMYRKNAKLQTSEELATLGEKEEKICAILAVHLDLPVEAISQNVSFFDLGGNSVSMMSVIAHMHQCGLQISIEEFSRARTVKDMIADVQPGVTTIPETLYTDRYLVCPLTDVTEHQDIVNMFAESFVAKEPLCVLLGIRKEDIILFSESLYHLALNQTLSFLVRDKEKGHIVGGDLLFDFKEDIAYQYSEACAPIEALLSEVESPVRKKLLLQSKSEPLLQNFVLFVDKTLPHAEQVTYESRQSFP